MTVIVLGCGRVGTGLARELVSRGREVVVVDTDPDALRRLGPSFAGRCLEGSALDRQILLRAGVTHADGLAAVTGSDAVNATVARAARVHDRVPVVVARLYDPRKGEVYDRLGVRTVAPVTWGTRRIADLLTATGVDPVAALGTGGVELVEVVVPPLLVGRAAAELEVTGEIQLVAVTRHGRTALASGASRLEAGDLLHLAVAERSLGRLETLLGER